MEKKMKRGCGNWVDGERFWDRETEMGLLKGYLDDGANVLLIAQRRMGKTSLLRELGNRIGGDYLCMYIDLESCQSAPDAVVEISMALQPHRDLWGKVTRVFQNILSVMADRIEGVDVSEFKIKLRAGVDRGNWQAKGDKLFELMAESGKPVVLFFDEVPILVNRILKDEDYALSRERIRDADLFMSWLRDNCQRYANKIRMVITGSIGLEPILRQVGLSTTVNHLKPFLLQPWDPETAIGCLEALGNQYGIQFEEDAYSTIVKKLGYCIPHHVQMYFDHIYEMCGKRNQKICNSELAEKVYKECMLSTHGHVELSHYEERLKLVLGDKILPFALDILTETAVRRKLTDEVLRGYCQYHQEILKAEDGNRTAEEVMGVLEHDGYLKRSGSGYVFHSRLLRDWWKAHYGRMFIPLQERIG